MDDLIRQFAATNVLSANDRIIMLNKKAISEIQNIVWKVTSTPIAINPKGYRENCTYGVLMELLEQEYENGVTETEFILPGPTVIYNEYTRGRFDQVDIINGKYYLDTGMIAPGAPTLLAAFSEEIGNDFRVTIYTLENGRHVLRIEMF